MMRNSTLTTIAPTGTISILSACSSGIEPLFALSFTRRNILEIGKTEMVEFNLAFSRALARRIKKRKLRGSILEKVAQTGSCQEVEGVPSDLARIFVTSHDISFKWHVAMQAAWQKHVDSAVSKTINLPQTSTVEDVYQAYLTAYESGCMGVTIYRDKSREQQVLNLGQVLKEEIGETALRESAVSDSGNGERKEKEVLVSKHNVVVTNGDSGICPECRTSMVFHEGCVSCPNCSFSVCSVG